MLKNYLTILWRNIYRYPFYTILNLACLTIGITATILIFLYINFELNYDKFHKLADQVFRIETQAIQTQEKLIEVNWQTTTGNFAPIVKKDYPEVDEIVRFIHLFFRMSQFSFSLTTRVTKKKRFLLQIQAFLMYSPSI